MNQERPVSLNDSRLQGIQNLLSRLHGEVASLESSYAQVLLVLQKIQNKADRDDLTGLLRRNSFFDQWNELLAECAKLNEECGVLLIDIDHFKKINDEHGHPVGDEVIRQVASLLGEYESAGMLAARYGGEEFALVVRGDAEAVAKVGEEIRARASTLEGIAAGKRWKCTVSVGASTSRVAGYDSEAQLKSADDALYAAKRSGRNCLRAA